MEKRFVGKVALVTGATRGMGQATAVRLAAEGALVGVNHRPTGDPSATLQLIKEVGGEGFPVVADMRNPGQVIEMVQEVARRGGRLDYLVSNAGINPFMPWDETTVEDWDNLSETNLRGTWVVTTEGAKQMVKEGHGGAIVCISSISAHVGSPFQAAYCATKGGISMWAKALRRGRRGARHPGQRHRARLDQDGHGRADDRRSGRRSSTTRNGSRSIAAASPRRSPRRSPSCCPTMRATSPRRPSSWTPGSSSTPSCRTRAVQESVHGRQSHHAAGRAGPRDRDRQAVAQGRGRRGHEGRADRPDRDREGQPRRRGPGVGRAPSRSSLPEGAETAIFSTIGIIGEPGEDISGIG